MDAASDHEWDAFVAANGHGYHEQTSAYGATRVACGFGCDRVIVRDSGQIVGGAQVLSQRTPVGRFGQLLRGPLAKDDDAHLMRRVVGELDNLARRRRIRSMRVDMLPTQNASMSALEQAGYNSSNAWSQERPSLVLRLGEDDEALFSSMKRKTRYNIALARRAGVTVRFGQDASVDDFYRLRMMTASHQGFQTFDQSYFRTMWELFGNAGRCQLIIAYYKDEAVATMMNFIVGGRLYCLWGGMHRGEVQKRVMANYLLHFEAMRWARDHGCTHYDLIGVSDYKQKFAQEEIRWPQPRRKFFGALSGARRALMDRSWSNNILRRGVTKAALRLKLKPRMPY